MIQPPLSNTSVISISLAISLMVGVVVLGRYLQRVDSIDKDLVEMRKEMRDEIRALRFESRELRDIVLRGYEPARSSRLPNNGGE